MRKACKSNKNAFKLVALEGKQRWPSLSVCRPQGPASPKKDCVLRFRFGLLETVKAQGFRVYTLNPIGFGLRMA